jgi:hypothetical protein
MVREIVVEFDAGVHSLDALRAAAYRLMGVASCQIENNGQKFICQITPNPLAQRVRLLTQIALGCISSIL